MVPDIGSEPATSSAGGGPDHRQPGSPVVRTVERVASGLGSPHRSHGMGSRIPTRELGGCRWRSSDDGATASGGAVRQHKAQGTPADPSPHFPERGSGPHQHLGLCPPKIRRTLGPFKTPEPAASRPARRPSLASAAPITGNRRIAGGDTMGLSTFPQLSTAPCAHVVSTSSRGEFSRTEFVPEPRAKSRGYRASSPGYPAVELEEPVGRGAPREPLRAGDSV